MKNNFFIILLVLTLVSSLYSQTNYSNLIRDAEVFYNIGSYKKAIETYEKIILSSPILKPEFFANLARSYTMEGKMNEAIRTARAGIRFNASVWQIHFQEGYAYYKLEDYNRALQSLTYAISLSQNNAYLYNFRGLIYLQIQDYKKAEEDFIVATTYSPGNPTYLCNLASSYESQKNYKEAVLIYQRAIVYDPDNKTPARTSFARMNSYMNPTQKVPGGANTAAVSNTQPANAVTNEKKAEASAATNK